MTPAYEAAHATLAELARLRKALAKRRSKQVYSASELDLINANVHTWFHTRRPLLLPSIGKDPLLQIDAVYREILAATNRGTSRSRYISLLKNLQRSLNALLAEGAVQLFTPVEHHPTPDVAPSFASIASDPEMRDLLTNRWNECVSCVDHRLPLAATVMMGGLLESLLVARINKLPDQPAVFRAKSAPKSKATGHVLNLREWTLSGYIDVAHELGWISDTYKDVGAVLRDYRNYIHPYKEYQHKKKITPDDSRVLWEIGKVLVRQVLKM